MRSPLLIAALAIGLSIGLVAAYAQQPANAPLELKDLKQQVSYIVGSNMGKTLKDGDLDLDPAIVMRAIQDTLAGQKSPFSDAQVAEIMQAFEKQMVAKEAAKAQTAGATNKQEGDAFLEANKKNPDVKTTASGLEYKVLKSGTGAAPKATDTVIVHYRGRLINGKEFDSSYSRGQPAEFGVGQVIPGWTEALQLMKVGDKWEVYIPSNLAYGAQGAGQLIGPNSVLIFEMELLGIK